MASFSVALPLEFDATDGFRMIKEFNSLIRQNLKMILLTDPGERVMDPLFGAGIKTFLFESFNAGVGPQLEGIIRKQVSTYMPSVQIEKIDFHTMDPDANTLGFAIVYNVPQIGVKDLLEFTI
jgi:hypothetical protein